MVLLRRKSDARFSRQRSLCPKDSKSGARLAILQVTLYRLRSSTERPVHCVSLRDQFDFASLSSLQIIISEQFLHEEKMKIRPVALGGIAGTTFFCSASVISLSLSHAEM